MIITITEQDVDKALEADKAPEGTHCTKCVVAQAVKRMFPDKYVFASYNWVRIGEVRHRSFEQEKIVHFYDSNRKHIPVDELKKTLVGQTIRYINE